MVNFETVDAGIRLYNDATMAHKGSWKAWQKRTGVLVDGGLYGRHKDRG